MTDAVSIALSGLKAQNQRLAASASNIANVATTGAFPTAESPATTVYKPLSVSYTALTTGGAGAGVQAQITENQNGYTAVYDPSNIYANKDGIIAAPNVDLAQEITSITETKSLFKANLAVLKTQNDMLGELMDTLT